MKKIIFGIFAHPDDETFGPSATLMKEVDAGAQLHLIMVTDGEAGANPDNAAKLDDVRLSEWQQAASAIGALSTHALHYPDGGLSHNMYHEIGAKIRQIVLDEIGKTPEPAELSFMTFDQNGITGHLDHIAVSYITTQLFCTIKDELPENIELKELAYYCLSMEQASNKEWTTYYTPIGRDESYINRVVDVRSLLPRKYEVMDIHHSQRADAQATKALGDDALARDCFFVKTTVQES